MSPAKNWGSLTEAELFHLGHHAMDNGAALIEEARLLLEHGRHARAFGLAVLAYEEAGKAFMCAQWAGRKPIPTEPDEWQPFWDHFRDHVPKYVRARHFDWPKEWGWDREALKELERLAKEHQRYKEWCFYVAWDDGTPSTPMNIERAVCVTYVEQAEEFFHRVLGRDGG